MVFERQYLGWDKPFSIAFAECLKAEISNGREFDDLLIWVPSARAGRHILSELFSGSTEGVEAFHPPRLVTPAQFLGSLQMAASIASEAQRLVAWKSILLELDPHLLKDLYPVIPKEKRLKWAYSMAQQLMTLRARISDDGYDFNRIAAADLEHDQNRWNCLARLEAAYRGRLEREGLVDPDDVLVEGLRKMLPQLPYKRLLIAGVLNLSKRQQACVGLLQTHGLQIDLYLPVPASRADNFDQWGRPKAGDWNNEAIPGTLLEGRLKRAAEPRELVDRILDLADVYKAEIDTLVLGSADPETARYLIERSRLTATACYAPEGKSLSETGWGRLIKLLVDWQDGGSLGTLLELMRNSLFRKWALNEKHPLERLERQVLTLEKQHLFHQIIQLRDPALRASKAIGEVRDFLKEAAPVLGSLESGNEMAERLWIGLQLVASSVELSKESLSLLSQLEEVLQDLKAEFSETALDPVDFREVLQYLLATRQHYPEREAEERPVSGWLELPWERAPHLVVLGLPDNQVPGSDGTDSFLTPVLCRQLALYGPDETAAFHAFRLRLLLECRQSWGKLDILLPDRGMDDDPVLATRFLFLAEQEEVSNRVKLLLSEQPSPEISLPSSFGTVLNLPEARELKHVSVTHFSSYLGNPFHYFLERRLRWSVPQALPKEMDAMRFGSLAHSVLEALNGTPEGVALSSEKDIAAFLESELEAEVKRVHGSGMGVPLRIQAGSLRERLRIAAHHISEERRKGWKPFEIEWAFGSDGTFQINGISVHGKVDLLEINEETGAYRIIDYKTSDTSAGAMSSHLFSPKTNSADPLFPECDFILGGKRWRWRDLQLPLYQLAVQQLIGERPQCAYFCLTKAVQDIKLDEWTPSEEESAAALRCAEKIIQLIQAGWFPFAGSSRYEDHWLSWFGGDYAKGIDPAWVSQPLEVES